MVLISETEFKRANGVGLTRPQTKILGEIALKGSISGGKILELTQDPKLVEELLKRKIIKRNTPSTYCLGEFGQGHCQWIWGKRGKPKAGKRRNTIKTKKGTMKPRQRENQPKEHPAKPRAPRPQRDAHYKERKRMAIERHRHRFRP